MSQINHQALSPAVQYLGTPFYPLGSPSQAEQKKDTLFARGLLGNIDAQVEPVTPLQNTQNIY